MLGIGNWQNSISQLEGKLHQIVLLLEPAFGRKLTSVVRFHPLQSVREKSPALEVHFSIFCHDAPFNFTSWPEPMSHRSPRMFRICTKIAFAILPYMKSRSRTGYIQVDDASFVCSRFDSIGSAVFIKSDGAAVAIERQLLLIESMAIHSI